MGRAVKGDPGKSQRSCYRLSSPLPSQDACADRTPVQTGGEEGQMDMETVKEALRPAGGRVVVGRVQGRVCRPLQDLFPSTPSLEGSQQRRWRVRISDLWLVGHMEEGGMEGETDFGGRLSSVWDIRVLRLRGNTEQHLIPWV